MTDHKIDGIPVRGFNGEIIGSGTLWGNGVFFFSLHPGFARTIGEFLTHGLVDSISIGPNLIPAHPTEKEWEESEKVLDASRRQREERSVKENYEDQESYMDKARRLVRQYIEARLDKSDPPVEFDVYLVWFSKTLQNWKALASSTLPDGMYYEVTYNGDKQETYIDAYKKVENVRVPDTLEQMGFEILEF
jgi:hypothetical protein